jgi:hypothetical protein
MMAASGSASFTCGASIELSAIAKDGHRIDVVPAFLREESDRLAPILKRIGMTNR